LNGGGEIREIRQTDNQKRSAFVVIPLVRGKGVHLRLSEIYHLNISSPLKQAGWRPEYFRQA